jgi:hypothetical protein
MSTALLQSALSKYLVAAMLTWAPPSIHAYLGQTEEIVRDRYEGIADDLAAVALDPNEKPLFAGPTGREQSAVFIDAWMSYESGGFRNDVDTVEGTGDSGNSHCLAQVQLRRGEVMKDRKDCFRLAFARMRESFAACASLPLKQKGSVYAAGNCTQGRHASEIRMNRAMTWWASSPWLPPVAEVASGS